MIMIALGLSLCGGAQSTATESLVIEPTSIDFGAIAPGSSQVGIFTLHNRSDKPLQIASALPSCKCTTLTNLTGVEIAPGSSVELKATLEAPRSPGKKDAKVFVTLAGQAKPAIAKMEGMVTMPVQPSPPFLDALKGKRNGVIDLTAGDGKPFQVIAVDGAAPVFADFDPSKDAPRSHYLIRWDLSMVADEQLRQWMIVQTSREDCPLIPLRIRNEATGIRFDPEADMRGWFLPESIVLAGVMKAGGSADLSVTYESSAPKGKPSRPQWNEVQSVVSSSPDAHAQLLTTTAKDSFTTLTMRFTLSTKASGLVYAPVTIQTATGNGRCFVAAWVQP